MYSEAMTLVDMARRLQEHTKLIRGAGETLFLSARRIGAVQQPDLLTANATFLPRLTLLDGPIRQHQVIVTKFLLSLISSSGVLP